jgi:cell division protein FtsQ
VSGPGGSYRDGEPSLAEAADGPGMTTAMAAPAAEVFTRRPQSRRPKARRPKARRPRARWVAVLLLLAAMGVAGGVTWALFDSSLFAVRSVVVTGTRLVPESEVLAVAGVQPGTPLIRVSTARIAARVLTITQVQGVQVTKTWPDRVVIAVRERTSALAVALPGGGFDLIDANGVIVQSAATRPASLPLYTTTAAASSLRGDPGVAAAAAVLGALPGSLRSSVTSVVVPSPDQVTLNLGSGVTILWGGADDTAAKVRELAILMQTHARSYDVSSPATAVTN